MDVYIADIPVEIVKKNIKNLHLAVLPPNGKVRISAPAGLSDEAILLFAKTKIGWIRKQQEKFKNQPRQSERKYVSGGTHYERGKQS